METLTSYRVEKSGMTIDAQTVLDSRRDFDTIEEAREYAKTLKVYRIIRRWCKA